VSYLGAGGGLGLLTYGLKVKDILIWRACLACLLRLALACFGLLGLLACLIESLFFIVVYNFVNQSLSI